MDKRVSRERFGAGSRPLAHHDFRPDINGLRALAVLSVLGFHGGLSWLPGGFAGVDIFFVISGFLISRIILSEREAGQFSFADFYGKRVKRILPALLVVLFVAWLMGWLWLDPGEFRRFGGHMEASSYFSVNLWLYRQSNTPGAYFLPDSRYFPLLHLWSLSVEEQFYLVWPAFLLGLFKAKRFLAPGIVAIFVVSLAFSIHETGAASTAAFYLLSARAWELALGAMLAAREVFSEKGLVFPGSVEFRARLGLVLMLGSVGFLSEGASWPGYLALAPTLGCALVISAPGAKISRLVLGNHIAQFFGWISYPLYLWHWPLLSIAHNRFGDDLPVAVSAGLLALSALLAFLTWKFIEVPIGKAYRRKPLPIAALLLAGLALTGLLGSATRRSNGFPRRFPEAALAAFNYRSKAGEGVAIKSVCVENRIYDNGALDAERQRVRNFFADHDCLKLDHPGKSTIVLLGDSHALHFLPGLGKVYGDRANIVTLSAILCAPLIARTDWREGLIGSNRCRAVNEEILHDIVELKPAAIVVSAYFAQFYHGYLRRFPSFLSDFDANVDELRKAGVHAPIFVMGEVPTWSPGVPLLVGRELLAGDRPKEFSSANLNGESLETDALLSAHRWGENVFYLSQVKALCDERGCRRFVGPRVPDDMIASDYGHYSVAGSIYAVKNILAPALAPALDAARLR